MHRLRQAQAGADLAVEIFQNSRRSLMRATLSLSKRGAWRLSKRLRARRERAACITTSDHAKAARVWGNARRKAFLGEV
jgi:hypothetical protein